MDGDPIDYLGEFLFRAIRWLLVIFVPLVFAAGFAVRGCMAPEPAPPPEPKVIREYYQQCQGCGEWLYKQDGPPEKPLLFCPFCPAGPLDGMTIEEFEEFQRQLREKLREQEGP